MVGSKVVIKMFFTPLTRPNSKNTLVKAMRGITPFYDLLHGCAEQLGQDFFVDPTHDRVFGRDRGIRTVFEYHPWTGWGSLPVSLVMVFVQPTYNLV